ncbi:RNA methyltransferase [Algibacter amylolyticus]|uniref:RNA methyltransferase n=1 Tax=Algibacter amylolyticus TaxID=1608400 RepID=A0A5M7B7E3_9FLAO|nr:RNA methyltransferase [Algibacter amylolyticus]KAA5824198.1 RNA methyltransferase [Algibacter amylolyticus]MBB5269758.1 TrmH family RNA methyltransferase [Algibacter amylolyticus]TSJ74675.1 RNA methyltransferase [Algibacter amylolyticus]
MLSKSQIKLITSLKQKKYRQQHGFFVVEGVKTITELLQSHLELYKLYTTRTFNFDAKEEVIVSNQELKRISFLTTPNTALAVFKMPEPKPIDTTGLIVVLDAIRDPGNLGTIIRLCDWFGVTELVCSKETVDRFNPKVVQATMGSITRVNVNYIDLVPFLKGSNLPVYGAFMEGENVYKSALPKNGILLMGNEANGVSKEVEAVITEKISIPRFGELQATESLNVATATAILLSEFRRG